jgi:hypothetical protein
MPVVLADASTLFNKAASRFAGLPPFTSGVRPHYLKLWKLNSKIQ